MLHNINLHLHRGRKESNQKTLSVVCNCCSQDFTESVGVQALIDTYHTKGTSQSWDALLNLGNALGDCPEASI